jgi:hypothetical protein
MRKRSDRKLMGIPPSKPAPSGLGPEATTLVSLLPKAVTGALRVAASRRQKANGISAGVTVTTVDMCALADRLETGAVMAAEMKLAAKLVMALVDRLPEDSAIDVGAACD